MVLDITKDGFLSLMNDKGISRDDIKIEAKDFNLIKESLDNDKEIIAIVIND
jgi:hypothetical protein